MRNFDPHPHGLGVGGGFHPKASGEAYGRTAWPRKARNSGVGTANPMDVVEVNEVVERSSGVSEVQ